MISCWTICCRKQVQAMATEFSREFFADNRIVKASLRCAHKLREKDLDRIKSEIKKLYDATEVILNITVDESLLSGYVLQVGDRVFDNSGRHQLDKMMEGKPSLATLKTRIEDYKPAETSAEGGVVISSADGIVHIDGMNRAVYGEIVTFENGAKGMVESVEPEQLGVMLFDGAETVGVGTMVTRSGKRAGIPVGDAFLGRVISPLGEPIDGKGPIEAEGYNPIEKQAPSILERQSVDTPLHTGILAIDSMFPMMSEYYYASDDAITFDLEKAKELLAAEGYDESNPLTFEIIGYSNNDVVMQAYQADLKSIGVNVELVTQEFGVFLENMVGMNFQMLTGGWGDTTGNPLTSAECYYSGSFGSQNISFYDNPVCDELYITAKTSNDTAEIKDACQQIQQIAWEDVPMFPTFGRTEGYVYNKNLNGVVIAPSGTLSFRTATLG